MEERRIIGLSGRVGSGKSELGKVCVELGFERLYFALPLKKLICELLGFKTIEELNDNKNNVVNTTINDDIFNKIETFTNIPRYCIESTIEGKLNEKSTVRDWLQVIGTDVIRQYNTNWHITEIKKMMKDDVNYVFDDVRFPNELEFLLNEGAECWFIIRDNFENISQHASEVSLSPFSFGFQTIINNGDLNELKEKWRHFIQMGPVNNVVRDDLINIMLSGGNIDPQRMDELLIHPQHKSLVDANCINKKTSIQKVKDGYKFSITTDNMFILEKLKELM